MRHLSVAAIALLAALPTAGCVEVPGPYYRETVVQRYYPPPYAYRVEPQIVYVQPGYYPRHRHERWRD
ncbi:MAG: hypothetical protein HY059_20170 [Proteobacteria bacterium]|nr:hypothetical protein [Pseudomonadota bacterium]